MKYEISAFFLFTSYFLTRGYSMRQQIIVLLLASAVVFTLTGCVSQKLYGDDPQNELAGLKAAIKAHDWGKAITFYEEIYAKPNLKMMRNGTYFLRPRPSHPNAKMFPVAPDDEGYSTDIDEPNAVVKFYRLIDEQAGTRRPVKIYFERIGGMWKIKAEENY